MSFNPHGGSAFPRPKEMEYPHEPGMELRDYFAAKALPVLMQAAIDNDPSDCEGAGPPCVATWEEPFMGDSCCGSWASVVAESSYLIADAMLAARRPKGNAND